MSRYDHGADVLGEGIADFVPWLGIVSSVAGGVMGGKKKDDAKKGDSKDKGSSVQQIQQAIEQERNRQALVKAQADASNTKMLLFGVLGLGGLGRERAAALALLGDHGEKEYEEEHVPLSQRDGLMTEEEVFGADDLDRADRAQQLAPQDSLAQKSMIRQGAWSDLQKIAPFARVNPPSVLQGTLGGQQPVTFGQNRQVANWGGSDAETLPVTVTLAVVQPIGGVFEPPFLVRTDPYRPYGIVQFGTRGFLTKIEVDIATGCQFTVTGSQVTVQVALPEWALGFPPGFVPEPMLLSGMLSFYPCVRTVPLTRTLYIDLLLAGATTPQFIVPPFAKNVRLVRSDSTNAANINFIGKLGALLYSYTLAAGAFMFDPLPLTGDVTYITVTNNGGAMMAGQLLFELAL